jgi:predicted membrane-bound spermidine synthase
MPVQSRKIFFLIFTLSGFSGLIYESIWAHYLKLFLGHAAYAQTLVLAIFMGGMAIGSWFCSRYSARWGNLLLGYAIAEGVIGILALFFHNAFTSTLDLSYVSIIPRLGNPAMITFFKWTISALMILPQSVLLGLTFPLMSAGVLRKYPDKPGRSVSMLYFTNSIGAAVGVLTSGFLLIRFVGLPGTIRIAGLINIVLAITVWSLINKSSEPHTTDDRHIEENQRTESKHPGAAWYRFLLLASLVTGTASFIYEIGWIRMLSLVLGGSTHAFELMLSAFIFGLAFGGLWIQRNIDNVDSPVHYLAKVQIIMGLLALSTLLLYGHTFEAMQWFVNNLPKTDTGYALFNLSSNAIAIAVMLPTTFFAGMTLPLITFILIREGYGERSIGAVYAANTVGAILGVVFAIHLGMPLLGLKGLITFGAGLDISLGIALFFSVTTGYRTYSKPVLMAAIGIGAVAGTLLFVNLDPFKMASGVYRSGKLLKYGDQKLIYHKDGKTATVSVLKDVIGVMSIRTNGKSDASIMMTKYLESAVDESTMVLTAVIPMALNPQARDAATIGLGSGLTTHTLLCNPHMREVDTVEIEQGMVEAANNFRPSVELAYADPRSKIHIDDAKTFFSTYNKKYDLILSEPSNPWVSGVAGLFSKEFYGIIKHHMNDNGLFVQWVQLYEINLDLVASVLKAVSENFSDYELYTPNQGDMIIIARKTGSLPELNENIMKIPAISELLKRIHVKSVQDILLRKIGTKKIFDRFLESIPMHANSDYYPVLDQNASKTRFLGSTAQELLKYTHEPLPTLEMLSETNISWRDTDIVQSSYFQNSQAAFIAMALRDYFISGGFRNKNNSIPAEFQSQALRLKKLFYDCNSATDKDERLGLLFNISVSMIPFLRPHEIDPFWKTLESGKCYSDLSQQEKKWISLLKSTGNRDPKKMRELSKTLLEDSGEIPLGAKKYLIASGMLGALSQKDYSGSHRLWLKHRPSVFGDKEPDLLFRLLATESTTGN